MFQALEISASGLSAQRARMNIIAKNIANAGTTRAEGGEPYRRQEVILEAVGQAPPAAVDDALVEESVSPSAIRTAREGEQALAEGRLIGGAVAAGAAPLQPGSTSPQVPSGGVRVAGISVDDSELSKIYDPSHPDADENGFVAMPNVNMVNEMVDMMMAARAYEANLAVMNSTRDLLLKTLTIGKP
jgi:flagellar basal-body rod protein FlgC